MEKPVISVIIPSYNEEKVIGRTLQKLRNQNTKIPYEIIVCDNNSNDRTVSIAKKYADKVVLETKQGSAFARNTGTKCSVGQYLVHTDADTIFPTDFIEKVYSIFKQEKYTAFSCGHWNFYDGNSTKVKIISLIYGLYQHFYSIIQAKKNTVTLFGWCLCTPRRIYDMVGGFSLTAKYKFEDVSYSFATELLGWKGYFPNIKVQSSLRRFEDGLIGFWKYYRMKKAGISFAFNNFIRKSIYKPK
jgi:glycosyltransferase involved in cell wall biosynthesis